MREWALIAVLVAAFLVAAFVDVPVERQHCFTGTAGNNAVTWCIEEGINGEAIVCRTETGDDISAMSCTAIEEIEEP